MDISISYMTNFATLSGLVFFQLALTDLKALSCLAAALSSKITISSVAMGKILLQKKSIINNPDVHFWLFKKRENSEFFYVCENLCL